MSKHGLKSGPAKFRKARKLNFSVKLDNNLKFDNHVSKLVSKPKRKLSALSRLSKFLSFEKRRALFKGFVESQFK